MIPPFRVRRPSRPVFLTILVTALLALPMGVVLASHQFGDVPNSNPFHADIDALVDSGVTAGCGGGNYCPSANVTRDQMAAFMNRLGALGPGKAPVVNADRLDGLDSKGFFQYGSTLPSGALLTGTLGAADTGAAGSPVAEDDVEFQLPLTSTPTVHIIDMGDPVPAGCSGTVSNPNASAGHLCIFIGWQTEAEITGFYSVINGDQGASPRGTVVYQHDDDNDGFTEFTGTWAVRAPATVLALPDEAPGEGPKGGGQ